jgi:hypothetical protein
VGQGSYSLVLEDDRSVHGRVRVAGNKQYEILSNAPIPVGAFTHVSFGYDAATGTMAIAFDGVEKNRVTHPAAPLEALTDKLTLGGPAGTRAACPDGDGAFAGLLDEAAVSRTWRLGTLPPAPDMAMPMADGSALSDGGTSAADAAVDPGGDPSQPGGTPPKGGCALAHSAPSVQITWLLLGLPFALLGRRRRVE